MAIEMDAKKRRFIETAKDIEIKGLRYYQAALKKVKDPNSRELLKFLIKEEEGHLAHFIEMSKDKEPKIKKLKHPLFDKKAYNKVQGQRSILINIFNTSLEMEEEGIKYYLSWAKKATDKKLSLFLRKLAAMEMDHFKLIKSHQDSIYNMWYWQAIEEPRMEM